MTKTKEEIQKILEERARLDPTAPDAIVMGDEMEKSAISDNFEDLSMFEQFKQAIGYQVGRAELVAENARLTAERDAFKAALEFYGIEILEGGQTQFKPTMMNKWRKTQNETENAALEAQVAEMKELLDTATYIQIGKAYFMKHHPELGWRVYCGSVSIGGVSVTEYLTSPLEAFKAVKEKG